MRHSRNLCIGPGGRKCICCFPAPGSKERRLAYRAAKKRDKKQDMDSHVSDYYHSVGNTRAGNEIGGL